LQKPGKIKALKKLRCREETLRWILEESLQLKWQSISAIVFIELPEKLEKVPATKSLGTTGYSRIR